MFLSTDKKIVRPPKNKKLVEFLILDEL